MQDRADHSGPAAALAALMLATGFVSPAWRSSPRRAHRDQDRPDLPAAIGPCSYDAEAVPEDEGVAGARMGIADDNTTGRFTKQTYVLEEKALR